MKYSKKNQKALSYKEYLNKTINKEHHFSDILDKNELKAKEKEQVYFFMVYRGNNDQIIRYLLKARGNFKEVQIIRCR